MNKSLAKTNPEMIVEWHPTKNRNLTPDDVTAGSSEKVWWICEQKHEFDQQIRYHVTTKRCPICTGRRVTKQTSFAALYPKLAKEWHSTLNGELHPENFRPGSQVKVYWQCPVNKDHIHFTAISTRVRSNTKCPLCYNKSKISKTALHKVHPELLSEWDYKKNKISPKSISSKSDKKVFWICKNNLSHSYQISVREKVRGKSCTICKPTNHLPNVLPTLNVANPLLLAEWDYKKNVGLDPNKITAGSNKKVWWLCKTCNHSWQSNILNRFRSGKGCPNCAGSIVKLEDSLAIKYPKLLEEWDFVRNKNLDPKKITPGSGRRAWWICEIDKKHSWNAIIRERTKTSPNTCPHCKKMHNTLEKEFPEIAKEWHSIKNGDLTPADVTSKNNRKVWWQCQKDNSHVWEAVVKNRTILNSGCPFCYRERADIETTKDLIGSIVQTTRVFENYKIGIDNIVKLLKINIWDRPLKRAFRRMIFANLVTTMETYLSDTFIKTVLQDTALQKKYIESSPKFQKEKIEVSNIFKWVENIKKNIEEELLDITFHNIWKIQNMYNDVLDIKFPENIVDVNNIILLRHDIIHRNGKNKKGELINLNIFDIKNSIETINKFIIFIEQQYVSKFPEIV